MNPKKPRNLVDELRGASRLAVEATRGVTDLVEAMHLTIAGGPAVLGRPLAGIAEAITRPVYASIRGVTGVVGAGIDLALAQLAPLVGESDPGPERDALLAALNGVLGDYLAESGNPLAIEMRLRSGGQPLTLEREALAAAFPQATGKVLLLVHGSCMNDRLWTREGHDHGAALARDLGYTPLYLHYNSGLHVSTNGRAFAALLEQLAAAWPVPLTELVVLAHSMGGLVTRSACHVAEAEGLSWRRSLRAIVFLGSPHHGAPLERGGNWIDTLLGVSRYSVPFARLGQIRSAGVTDLRFGNVLDEHWEGRDRFANDGDPRTRLQLPDGVDCYAIAGTTASAPNSTLPGDGLVPLDSALGRHETPELSLEFPASQQWIARGVKHLDLLSSPEVYAKVRGWLSK
ncbi:MAG TPA: alpha/beta hydrolase [Labilithrix sp.]|nr:alpha/beta hydrolase [Labilithrix sp.]